MEMQFKVVGLRATHSKMQRARVSPLYSTPI